MQYRREIDGLRAVAVIPVILFHAGFTVFSGGYIGVDIFFVISGYLITSIIIRELGNGNFSILRFYERRARRILPALYFVMLACIPFAWAWMVPAQIRDLSQSYTAVVLFASNILFYMKSGYFEAASEEAPLLHTWSLAVEEQYYMVFPIFLIVLWKFGRNPILYAIVALSIVSLIMSEWGWRNNPSANFYLAPTRAWELLAGSICAFLQFNTAQKSNNALSVTGLGLIVFAFFYYDKTTPFPSVYALAPVVGTALIILYGASETWVARLLSLKAFVGVGLISYSAYLWHQPLFAFARIRSIQAEPSHWLMLGLSGTSLLLAYLTWLYIEHPFRKRPIPALPSKSAIFGVSAAFSVAFAALGFYGHINNGYKSQFTVMDGYNDIESRFPKIDNGWCFYSVGSLKDLNIGSEGLNCHVGSDDTKFRGVLFGDSFAGQYEPFWNDIGGKLGLKIQSITTNWCFPSITDGFTGPVTNRAFDQCIFNRKHFKKSIDEFDFIIMGGHWASVTEKANFEEVLEFLHFAASSGKPVVVMPSPKLMENNILQRVIYREAAVETLIDSHSEEIALSANKRLSEEAQKLDNVIYLDRASLFSSQGKLSELTDDGLPYSSDGSHISIYGSQKAAESFLKSEMFSQLEDMLEANLK